MTPKSSRSRKPTAARSSWAARRRLSNADPQERGAASLLSNCAPSTGSGRRAWRRSQGPQRKTGCRNPRSSKGTGNPANGRDSFSSGCFTTRNTK